MIGRKLSNLPKKILGRQPDTIDKVWSLYLWGEVEVSVFIADSDREAINK